MLNAAKIRTTIVGFIAISAILIAGYFATGILRGPGLGPPVANAITNACSQLNTRYYQATVTAINSETPKSTAIGTLEVTPNAVKLEVDYLADDSSAITSSESPLSVAKVPAYERGTEIRSIETKIYVRDTMKSLTDSVPQNAWMLETDQRSQTAWMDFVNSLDMQDGLCKPSTPPSTRSARSALQFRLTTTQLTNTDHYFRAGAQLGADREDLWFDSDTERLLRYRTSWFPTQSSSSDPQTLRAVQEWNLTDVGTTNTILEPTFVFDDYSFSVGATVQIGTVLGEVRVVDTTGYTTSPYSISSGNSDGKFAIDSSSGSITVNEAIGTQVSTFELTVEAAKLGGGTDSVDVSITVT